MRALVLSIAVLVTAANAGTCQPRFGDLIVAGGSAGGPSFGIYSVEPGTSNVTTIAQLLSPFNGVAMSRDNRNLAGLLFRNFWQIDARTGSYTTLTQFPSTFSNPASKSVVLDQDGSWVFAMPNDVLRLQGTVRTTLTSTSFAVGRDPDTGHYLTVQEPLSGNATVMAVDETGTVVGTVADTMSANTVRQLGVEPRTGHYVVATGLLQRYDRSGQMVANLPVSPVDFVIDDRTGNYWVLRSGSFFPPQNGSVAEVTPTGTVLRSVALPFNTTAGLELYGRRMVSGSGSAQAGTSYTIDFHFPDVPSGIYFAALSLAQRPGIDITPTERLNLAADWLFYASAAGRFVTDFFGTLDATGSATGSIQIPVAAPRGLVIYAAGVANLGTTWRYSNTWSLVVR